MTAKEYLEWKNYASVKLEKAQLYSTAQAIWQGQDTNKLHFTTHITRGITISAFTWGNLQLKLPPSSMIFPQLPIQNNEIALDCYLKCIKKYKTEPKIFLHVVLIFIVFKVTIWCYFKILSGKNQANVWYF